MKIKGRYGILNVDFTCSSVVILILVDLVLQLGGILSHHKITGKI